MSGSGANVGLCMSIKDVPTKRAIEDLYRLLQQRQMDARSIDPRILGEALARHIPEDVFINIERYLLAEREGKRMKLKNDQDSVTLLLTKFPGSASKVIDTDAGAPGAHLTAAGAWNNGCSRTLKRRFQKVDEEALTEGIESLPVKEREYKAAADGRHLGPTAEDFHEAFGLGNSRETLNTVDLASVALLGVQFLLRRVSFLEDMVEQLQKKVK